MQEVFDPPEMERETETEFDTCASITKDVVFEQDPGSSYRLCMCPSPFQRKPSSKPLGIYCKTACSTVYMGCSTDVPSFVKWLMDVIGKGFRIDSCETLLDDYQSESGSISFSLSLISSSVTDELNTEGWTSS